MSADVAKKISARSVAHHGLKNAIVACAVVVVVGVAAFIRFNASDAGSESATASAPTITGLPRMLDLGADRCIPCKQMAPILAELKTEYAGRAIIEFIDVWKDPDAGKKHGVRLIPTQIFYDHKGKEVWRHEGFLPKAEIVAKMKDLGVG